MNRMLIKTSILMLLAVASPSWAVAPLVPPHNSTNNIDCRSCHSVQSVLGKSGPAAFNNMCTSCHRDGAFSKTDGMITPFSQSDFANPFGTYSGTRPSVKYQTSHKWSGSDNVPKAGASSPVGSWPAELLNRTSTYLDLRGTLSCARCHDIHNANANAFVSRANHLLRADNTNDAMCLKCHVGNNSTTHLGGSHPINIDYAAAVAKDPTKISSSPVSSNPANYTASLQLVNGKVLCSTCHKLHFADGNSSTFDNRSSSSFGQLSTSKGHLLRTDLRGSSATARNVCTNCHIGKESHHGANQGVQCADCHGGHVNEADGTAANVYLVKRYINFSTAKGAVRNKQVLFQYTGATRNYRSADGKGVCQACHSIPPSGGISPKGVPYPPQHDSMSANVCDDCHSHKSNSGSFSGGCSSCHGFPPQNILTGGPGGKAAGYTGDESLTKHKKHADLGYSCVQCHFPAETAMDNPLHQKGSYQDVFPAAHKAGILASQNGADPVYNTVDRTCANTYCHSNGKPAGGTLVTVVTPAWQNGATTNCSSCHQASPTTNAHQAHISKGFGCETCHNATVKNSIAIFDRTKHANNVKEINFNNPLLGISGSSCANIYCHSNGKGQFASPVWTATYNNNCAICHASTGITTGAHQAHLSPATLYGPNLNKETPPISCNNCHSYPTGHVNGSIQVPSTCSVVCHPNGIGTSANWANGLRVDDCTTCHAPIASRVNKYASYKADFSSTPHNGSCTVCHNAASQHIGVAGGTARLNSAITVCTSCHNETIVGVDFRNLPTHFMTMGNPNMFCQECHDPHGTRNASMIRSKIAFINSTSWSIDFAGTGVLPVDHFSNRGFCQVCHTKTAHYRAGQTDAIPHYPSTNCFGCHKHRDDRGAFKPKGSCDTCHGYPPVPRNVAGLTFGTQNNWSSAGFEKYSGGGGAHTIAGHIPKSAKASEGWDNCAVCHSKGDLANQPYHVTDTPLEQHVNNITVAVDPRFRFNADKLVSYSSAQLVNPPLNKTGSCFNASCHFKPTPPWSNVK